MKADAEEENKPKDTFSLKGLPQTPFTTFDHTLYLTPQTPARLPAFPLTLLRAPSW